MLAALGEGDEVTYESIPSAKGYTTPQATNPNGIDCQLRYGNGITGSSGSYAARTQDLDRNPLLGAYPPAVFLDDQYDLTAYAGRSSAIRLSYSTDGGVARPGWFVDDLRIQTGDGTVLYSSDFESGADEPELFNGGGKGDLSTSDRCTGGWQYLNASERATLDHAYYLELRDRSGFDADGRGQNDRAAIAFQPGLLLTYTNEAGGYGNTAEAATNAPNQSPLDSVPVAGSPTPNLHDAAFKAGSSFSDAKTAVRPGGWIDNYDDEDSEYADKFWHFDYGCLSFAVTRMTGTGVGLPFDLQGDVDFTLGAGCAPFDYGFGVPNGPPTAVAQAKPTTVQAGDPVTLDGSGSYDDVQPAGELAYSWDVDGDGTFAHEGQTLVHRYAQAGTYQATLKVTDGAGLSATDAVTLVVTGPPVDLELDDLTASKAREGQRVRLTATIENLGTAAAAASKTEFLLDGQTVLGLVDTPVVPAGEKRTVSLLWDTRRVRGEHTIRASADRTGVVAEASEANNSRTLTVTVKVNKVRNGDYEDDDDDDDRPDGWSGQSGGAGSARYDDDGGPDGSKSVSLVGNGGSVALLGAPSWASDPIAVTPGETLELVASVRASGLSSAPTVSLAYLGAAGQVLQTVAAVTAPLTTAGFETLEQTVSVPAGVARVRIVLTGFSALDAATRGTVTFDDLGLYAT